MDKPLVSILINNYNYGGYLSKAIDSAIDQTYPHVEVIVVDDGSTDNSREIISSYGDRIISVFKENGGQASAFNAGFAASKGEIICLLDSDDIFLPEKVAEIVKVFQTDKNLGWCFHPISLVNTKDLVEPTIDRFLKIDTQDLSSVEFIDFRSKIVEGQLPKFVPPTSGLCFSRLILSQILPMPESKGISVSDLYVKYVAIYLGKGCVFNAKLAIQRFHEDNFYTGQDTKKKQKTFAEYQSKTAYWMRVNFPKMTRTANKIFAKGLGSYLLTGSLESGDKKITNDYLDNVSLLEKAEILLRAFYFYLRKRKW